jgi:hypothetical protein
VGVKSAYEEAVGMKYQRVESDGGRHLLGEIYPARGLKQLADLLTSLRMAVRLLMSDGEKRDGDKNEDI